MSFLTLTPRTGGEARARPRLAEGDCAAKKTPEFMRCPRLQLVVSVTIVAFALVGAQQWRRRRAL